MRAIFVLLVVAIFAFLGVSAQKPNCGENEVFQRCGTACERSCTNSEEWDKPCNKPCVDKCFCEDGFLRDGNNGCVRAWRCNPNP